jgi:hypothetical protein
MDSSALRDRRILVVEDEFLIAISLADALENAGSYSLEDAPARRLSPENSTVGRKS